MENNMSLSVVSLFLIQQFPLLTLRLAWPDFHQNRIRSHESFIQILHPFAVKFNFGLQLKLGTPHLQGLWIQPLEVGDLQSQNWCKKLVTRTIF